MRQFFVGLLSFAVLDGLWLGLLMKSFYRDHLGPLAMTAPDGSLSPIWPATIPVYLMMSLGLVLFVLPRAYDAPLLTLAGYGAVFGWILFGVYDLTNYATLRNYSPVLAMVDMAWGGVSCAITAVVMRKLGG